MTLDAAGPALDAWIAERVMEAEHRTKHIWRYPDGFDYLRSHSELIEQAWPVWERVTARRPDLVLGRDDEKWAVFDNDATTEPDMFWEPCIADTAALAICLAAYRVFAEGTP